MPIYRQSNLRVAAIQLASGLNRSENLRQSEYYLREAVKEGAEVCVLPEHFSYLGTDRECSAQVEPLNGALVEWGKKQAHRLGCWIVMGTFLECARRGRQPRQSGAKTGKLSQADTAEPETCDETMAQGDSASASQLRSPAHLPYNVCCVIDQLGIPVGEYRKMHLFNSKVPGAGGCEADFVRPGKKTACIAFDDFWSLGLAVCYDLRFPEQFRDLRRQGANILAVPAAFAERTGRDHWELLLRARAVENQAYVIAANQCGQSGIGRYGHSMIVDPWGTVIAQAGEQPGIVFADLKASYIKDVRQLFG